MLPEGIGEVAAEFAATRPATNVVVCKVPDPRAFGVVEVDSDGAVIGLAEKPLSHAATWRSSGCTSSPKPYIGQWRHRAQHRDELKITDAIHVRTHEYRGSWKDAGSPEDVLDCDRKIMATLQPWVTRVGPGRRA